MIKSLLIHNLLDICLDNFFEELFDNFHTFKFDANIYAVGDYLQIRLMIKNRSVILRSCKIESKNEINTVIVSMDFGKPIKLIVKDGTISDIKGDLNLVYKNLFS